MSGKKRSYVKQAEQNVLNICRELELVIEALAAFGNFGSTVLKSHRGRDKFFEGLRLMESVLRQEYLEQILNCIVIIGVGGEEATKYAREKAKKYFGGNYHIMSFLDKWGHISFYKESDEKEFKKEIEEIFQNQEKTQPRW